MLLTEAMPKRVLIDLRCAHFEQERGIPNYASRLAIAIASENIFDCSFLAHKYRPRLKFERELNQLGKIIWYEDLLTHGAPECDAFFMASVIHGLDNTSKSFVRYTIPESLAGRRPLLFGVLYDLIPLIFEDHYLTDANIRAAYFRALRILQSCNQIFTISEATRTDAIRHLNITPQMVETIPGGIDEEAWKKGPSDSGRGHDVVYVGGDDYRKNVKGLISGFLRFLETHPQTRLTLSIVCTMRPEMASELRSLAGHEDGKRVYLLGSLSQKRLVERVSQAKASIFPSLYEGLGLPILESYCVGTPALGSNNSSIAELIYAPCLFNPRSQNDIVAAFQLIDERPDILQRSVAFGKEMLIRHTWKKTSKIVCDRMLNRLNAKSTPRQKSKGPFVAIATALSPERTGVGHFSTHAFSASKCNIAFFSRTISRRQVKSKIRRLTSAGNDFPLYPLHEMGRLINKQDYSALVFVIGNSVHAVPILKQAIGLRAYDIPKFLYLHEANVYGLIESYYNKDIASITSRLSEFYPEVMAGVSPSHLYGLRLLHALIGDVVYIVNSTRCADLIRADLHGYATPRFETLFHPLLSEPIRNGLPATDTLRIGHFGIFHPVLKSPEIVISAAREIAKKRPTRLIFGGYECRAENFPHLADPSLIEWEDSPSDERLMELIKSVDVVVQPREWDHGESSGIISQAISAGKIPVTSANTAADDLGALVILVPKGSHSRVWARSIEEALVRQNDELPSIDHLSIASFGVAFDAALGRLTRTKLT